MKYIKLFEEINVDFDDWNDEEEPDNTKYRIVTLSYGKSRYRLLQFKKVDIITKKHFWKKDKTEHKDKWYFIPNGENMDIYGHKSAYPRGSTRSPFTFIHSELTSDNSDNYLKRWARQHPQIDNYLEELANRYEVIKTRNQEEKDRIDNLDTGIEYLDL